MLLAIVIFYVACLSTLLILARIAPEGREIPGVGFVEESSFHPAASSSEAK